MDDIAAWLEVELAGESPDFEVRKLHPDDGVTPDPGTSTVDELDGSAGPE
jgi:hypothetical protein